MPIKFAILNNKTAFPSFGGLPDEDDVDMRYFHEWGGSPRRHWCLLAEIVGVEKLFRTVVYAKDRDGVTSRIAFYPEREIDEDRMRTVERDLKVGHTIAVMYAFHRQFLDMSTGVRAETGSSITVIPLGLTNILALPRTMSKETQERSAERCSTCDKRKPEYPAPGKRCSQCRLYSYCDQDCQRAHWVEQGHKHMCKGLAAMRRMCDRDWNQFITWIKLE